MYRLIHHIDRRAYLVQPNNPDMDKLILFALIPIKG